MLQRRLNSNTITPPLTRARQTKQQLHLPRPRQQDLVRRSLVDRLVPRNDGGVGGGHEVREGRGELAVHVCVVEGLGVVS